MKKRQGRGAEREEGRKRNKERKKGGLGSRIVGDEGGSRGEEEGTSRGDEKRGRVSPRKSSTYEYEKPMNQTYALCFNSSCITFAGS